MNPALLVVIGAGAALAGAGAYFVVDSKSTRIFRLEPAATVAAAALIVPSIAWRFNSNPASAWVYAAFSMVLIAVTLFDFRTHHIPLAVTVPGAVAGLVFGTFVLGHGFVYSLIGLLAGSGVLILTTLVEAARKKEVGGGDWKYAAMIGAFIGWPGILAALILTGIVGAAGAIVLKAAGAGNRPQALGPWLSAGAILALLVT